MIPAALVVLADAPAAVVSNVSDYDRAVAARRDGHLSEALHILDRLRVTRPKDADVALQRGLTLFQMDRQGEAESEFRRTLQLAPHYDEARIGLARIAYGRGQYEAASAQLQPLAASGNAEAAELLGRVNTAMEAAPRDWQVDVVMAARRRISSTARITGEIAPSYRFGRTEVYSQLGTEIDIAPNATVHAEIGATPNADFLPSWKVGAGTRVKVRDGRAATVVLLDVTQAHYVVGDIQTVTPGVEQYFGNGKTWITGQWINLFDETGRTRSGWNLRADTYASDRLRLYAGYTHSPDTSAGITIDTRSIYGGAFYDLNSRYSLNLSLAHEDRSIGPNRFAATIGLGLKF